MGVFAYLQFFECGWNTISGSYSEMLKHERLYYVFFFSMITNIFSLFLIHLNLR